jgi:hypothetical protein
MSGRLAARRVQKALEEQIVLDGIDGGDAHAVGHQRVGDAAAGRDGDLLLAGKAHDVGHEQEERRKAVAADGSQLRREACLQRWPGRSPCAARQALVQP